MEEIKLTPEELKGIIDTGKFIDSGSEGSLFTYKGRLIKLDNQLYELLMVNNPIFSRDIVHDRYRWEKDDYNSREQLEELSKRQSKIRPRVPEGIITIKDDDKSINGISPGIIIPHFIDYEMLGKIPKTEYKKLLILLKQVFDDIKSLADNEIAHEDLFDERPRGIIDPDNNHYNIIQKGNDPQIIDMSGGFIKVGKEFDGADKMYNDFANLINYYNKINGLGELYKNDSHITEDKLSIMLNEFEKQTKKR